MTAMSIFGMRLRPENLPPLSTHRWPSFLGIELELEAVDFDGDRIGGRGNLWTTHDDASLRRGIEFVTNMPIRGEQVDLALDQYYEMVRDFSAGPRTSTHVHVNVSDVDSSVVKSMFFLMYILEEGVYATTEESRKWAGYSMPLREMRASRVRSILNPLNDQMWQQQCVGLNNSERYYGFNVNWGRHGTVEFRYFPGGPDREELEHWLDLPTVVKKVASQYTIEQLADMFHNPEQLTAFILGNFGRWGEEIVNSTSADVLFQYYQEVANLSSDDQEHVRSNIYYVSPRLRQFITNKILNANPDSVETFNKLLSSTVVTEDSLATMISMANRTNLGEFGEDAPYFREEENEYEGWRDPDEDDEEEERITERPRTARVTFGEAITTSTVSSPDPNEWFTASHLTPEQVAAMLAPRQSTNTISYRDFANTFNSIPSNLFDEPIPPQEGSN